MKKQYWARLLSMLVFVLWHAASVQSAVITTPAGLNPGDQFRVVFQSSVGQNALSSNIADYDQFIAGLAAISGIDTYFGSGVTWQVLGSTNAVSAISRVPVSSPPIFLVNGIKVADDGADLWDGSIDVPIVLDEFGFFHGSVVYTGTLSNGLVSQNGPLGGQAVFVTEVGLADIVFTNSAWVSVGQAGGNVLRPLYGISSILTVPTPAAVPEPASAVLLMLGLIGIASSRRRAG